MDNDYCDLISYLLEFILNYEDILKKYIKGTFSLDNLTINNFKKIDILLFQKIDCENVKSEYINKVNNLLTSVENNYDKFVEYFSINNNRRLTFGNHNEDVIRNINKAKEDFENNAQPQNIYIKQKTLNSEPNFDTNNDNKQFFTSFKTINNNFSKQKNKNSVSIYNEDNNLNTIFKLSDKLSFDNNEKIKMDNIKSEIDVFLKENSLFEHKNEIFNYLKNSNSNEDLNDKHDINLNKIEKINSKIKKYYIKFFTLFKDLYSIDQIVDDFDTKIQQFKIKEAELEYEYITLTNKKNNLESNMLNLKDNITNMLTKNDILKHKIHSINNDIITTNDNLEIFKKIIASFENNNNISELEEFISKIKSNNKEYDFIIFMVQIFETFVNKLDLKNINNNVSLITEYINNNIGHNGNKLRESLLSINNSNNKSINYNIKMDANDANINLNSCLFLNDILKDISNILAFIMKSSNLLTKSIPQFYQFLNENVIVNIENYINTFKESIISRHK